MRIGELAEMAGTTAKTLRFYEEQGLLPPAHRTPAGYRDYTPVLISSTAARRLASPSPRSARSYISATMATRLANTFVTCSKRV